MALSTPGTRPRKEFRSTGLWWSLVAAGILALAILIAILLNLQNVDFRYIGVAVQVPLGVILLITVVATAIFTAITGAFWRRRRRRLLTEHEELRELRARAVPAQTAAPVEPVATSSVPPEPLPPPWG